MPEKRKSRPTHQVEGAQPIIENPELPRMEDEDRVVQAKPSHLQAMPQDSTSVKPVGNLMPTEPMTSAAHLPAEGYPAQQPLKAAPVTGDGYVRLRVRVDDGKMSVLESHEVAGPLVEPSDLKSGFVYEVTLGQKRLHSGWIPDLGVSRSFPNPEGPPAEHGHHITVASTYEFNVRIPKKELSTSTLAETEIALYRVKEPAQNKSLGVVSLAVTLEREVREVARLKGIPPEALQPKK